MTINNNKILRLAGVITIFMFSSLLFAQEDNVSIKFSFKKPNEFICEILNKTNYRMIIRFNDMETLPLSQARFNIVQNDKDTIQNVFYKIKINPPYYVYLNSGQTYSVSFRDSDTWKFIKSKIYLAYTVETPIPKRATFEKTFDLNEIKKEHFCTLNK